MPKYMAKFGRVWKRLKDGRIIGRIVELTEGEKITGYTEVYEQKEDPKKDKKVNKAASVATEV